MPKQKKKAFCDRLCCTKHQYEIIGQTKNGYYVSSGVRTEIFSMSGAAISDLSGGKWIPLQVRREGAPAHRMESTAQVVYRYYYGFHLPQAETAQARSRRHQFAFSLPDNQYLSDLQALVGQEVIYKDQWGCCLTGVLDEMTADIKKKFGYFLFCDRDKTGGRKWGIAVFGNLPSVMTFYAAA